LLPKERKRSWEAGRKGGPVVVGCRQRARILLGVGGGKSPGGSLRGRGEEGYRYNEKNRGAGQTSKVGGPESGKIREGDAKKVGLRKMKITRSGLGNKSGG